MKRNKLCEPFGLCIILPLSPEFLWNVNNNYFEIIYPEKSYLNVCDSYLSN